MKFTVQNVGKIEHAVLQLNGITVVVGDNNAGKTTISRALYAFINSLCNIDAEVVGQRTHEITRLIRSFYSAFRRPFGFADRELRVAIERFVQNDNGQDDGFAIRQYLMMRFGSAVAEDEINRCIEQLVEIRNLPNKSVRQQIIENYFDSVFRGQCVSLRNGVDCGQITAVVDNHSIDMYLRKAQTTYTSDINVQRKAYFVESPDLLGNWGLYRPWRASSLSGSIRKAIDEKLSVGVDRPADSAFEDLLFAEKYNRFAEEVSDITDGHFAFDENQVLRFSEVDRTTGKSNSYDLNNVSEGVKSFGVLELLLRYRILREKDILILDEPEVHLHPEWQLKYAHLIVEIQKAFNLRVLITTHSPNFMLAIKYYSKLAGTNDIVNSYRVKQSEGDVRFSVISVEDPLDWDDAYVAFLKSSELMWRLQSQAMGNMDLAETQNGY